MKNKKHYLLTLLFCVTPLSTNYSRLTTHHRHNTTTRNNSSEKQIPLSASKKISNKGKVFANISAKQKQNKNIGDLKKNFNDVVHKNATIHLQSNAFFDYSISYTSWVKRADGSISLQDEKKVVKKRSKNNVISTSFFNIDSLKMHMGLAGQKDTKLTFVNNTVMKTLIQSKFKTDENPSFNLSVTGEITTPKTSLHYVSPKGKSDEVGTFKIESAALWWQAHSILMNFVITILFMAFLALGPISLEIFRGVSKPTDNIPTDDNLADSEADSLKPAPRGERGFPSLSSQRGTFQINARSSDLVPISESAGTESVPTTEPLAATSENTISENSSDESKKSAQLGKHQLTVKVEVHVDAPKPDPSVKSASPKHINDEGEEPVGSFLESADSATSTKEADIYDEDIVKSKKTSSGALDFAVYSARSEMPSANVDSSEIQPAPNDIIEVISKENTYSQVGLTEEEIEGNYLGTKEGAWPEGRSRKFLDPNKPEMAIESKKEVLLKLNRNFLEGFDEEHMGYDNSDLSYTDEFDSTTVRAPTFEEVVEKKPGVKTISNSQEIEVISKENTSLTDDGVEHFRQTSAAETSHSSFWDDILHHENKEFGDADADFDRTVKYDKADNIRLMDVNLPDSGVRSSWDERVAVEEEVARIEKNPPENHFTRKYPGLLKPYERDSDLYRQSMNEIDNEAIRISNDFTTMSRDEAYETILGDYKERGFESYYKDGNLEFCLYKYVNVYSAEAREMENLEKLISDAQHKHNPYKSKMTFKAYTKVMESHFYLEIPTSYHELVDFRSRGELFRKAATYTQFVKYKIVKMLYDFCIYMSGRKSGLVN